MGNGYLILSNSSHENMKNLAKAAIRDIFIQMPTRTVSLSNWNGFKNYIIGNFGESEYNQSMKELFKEKWLTKEKDCLKWKSDYSKQLTESTIKEKYQTHKNEYGCLMVSLKIPNWNKLLNSIKKEDIYDKPEYGLESNCHLTLLYGLHDNVTVELLKKITHKLIKNPISITLLGLTLFETSQFDVLKFDVVSSIAVKLNKILKRLPHTSTYPQYNPHITVAYLKPGTGKKYIKENMINHITINSTEFVYSDINDKKTHWDVK